jgi:beta-glucosidase
MGQEIATARIMHLGASVRGGIQTVTETARTSLAKPDRITAVDQIRAGKTNYTSTTLDIDSYSQDLGTVTITLRDIEGQIDSIMQGKSRLWKVNQCIQGCDANRSGDWGTYFFSWSDNQTLEGRANSLDANQDKALAAAGVPQLCAIDAVHGFSLQPPCTIFPHHIGLGASGNGPLIELSERITAIECRAQGINWDFAPCTDVVRDERHGRTYEGYDEGPVGSTACVYYAVRGLQGTDLSHPMVVSATTKHFAGAGGTMNGKHATDANTADHETLCRIHLPPFRKACETGTATVMAAFNSWLGTEMHLNKTLLTDTLKNRWKWDGFVTGDWDEATKHGVANCFNAGVDNPMTPSSQAAARDDINANGTAARIDDACRRILRTKLRMNLLADSRSRRELIPFVKSDLHLAVARECVRRSIVLLKNQSDVLPLKRSANVHVMGKWADDMGLQCGGWTVSWQAGANKDFPPGTTIREGIEAVCDGTVTYSETGGAIPASADVIVVAIGEAPYAESLGDKDPLYITAEHQALIQACENSGKPFVCILISGRPMVVTNEIDMADAFVAAFLPGTQGGGIADVLFSVDGEDFTAKLSHAWPRSMEQIPINAGDYGDRVGSGGDPLFPYGFGLSYTSK